ncbi:hypothetical protein PUR61_35045 [Streptomyces sp. BE20]|uniref:hypothetical protein n=1 Tax=unclassified Streptomyces TaxID=2593676 RepID=UPI002E78E695|nr:MULTISPECIES: hypothetical protein [unclassified Streptomyces]MED7947388.1 hypothetical protein [Streptomyces sp. BE303]MEE1827370.1 hypothetical protein [Streptomyces sp. BE20]
MLGAAEVGLPVSAALGVGDGPDSAGGPVGLSDAASPGRPAGGSGDGRLVSPMLGAGDGPAASARSDALRDAESPGTARSVAGGPLTPTADEPETDGDGRAELGFAVSGPVAGMAARPPFDVDGATDGRAPAGRTAAPVGAPVVDEAGPADAPTEKVTSGRRLSPSGPSY